MKTGRNDPCHCGSGKKYKKCCLAKDDAAESKEVAAKAAAAAAAAKSEEDAPPPAERIALDRSRDAPRAHPEQRAKAPSSLPRRKAV